MPEYEHIRTGRHRVFKLLYVHSVFAAKYRHPVSAAAHLTRMEKIRRDGCGDFDCELAEFNGEADHVPLLVTFPPKAALSRLVNSLNGVSSRRPRQEFPDLRRHYWRAEPPWARAPFFPAPPRPPPHPAPPRQRTAPTHP